ncbi:MAG: glycosyltransferase family 2 protein [Pseudomonadota bacterium]
MADALPPLAEITVSLVLYNSLVLLQQRQAFLAALPELCLVDNASTDGSADWIATHLPQARLLRCAENIGFGRGHNLALAGCTTPFALLLNPDCEIDTEAMQRLTRCLEDFPSALLTVPRLVYPDGREQDNHRGFTVQGGRPIERYTPPEGPACCEMVSGAAMMVRVSVFRELGGFDPWFFLYWEDEDLCYRARRQQRAVIFDPRVVGCHAEKKSSRPSARTLFIRHYSYGTSKLYLRRKCGESGVLIGLRVLGLLAANLLGLLPDLLLLKREKIIRRLAGIAAALTAPFQLGRTQAVPSPLQVFRA